MNKDTRNIVGTLLLFFLTITVVCVLIIMRKADHSPLAWWEYIDVLFLFLAAFCRLCSLMYATKLKAIARRFNLIALICLIMAIGAFLFTWFAMR